MFECLQELRNEVGRYVAMFDATRLDGDAAAAVIKDAAAIENMVTVVRAQAAKRVDALASYRREGYRSAAHQLAAAAGMSVGQAKEELVTAERLEQLPAMASLAREGKLSPAKAAVVADAATADPRAEQRLLERAERQSLGELREECARVKAAADP